MRENRKIFNKVIIDLNFYKNNTLYNFICDKRAKILKKPQNREIHILCAFSTSLNYTKYSFSIIRYKKIIRYQIYYSLSKNIKKIKSTAN